jgi:hypothetical protein
MKKYESPAFCPVHLCYSLYLIRQRIYLTSRRNNTVNVAELLFLLTRQAFIHMFRWLKAWWIRKNQNTLYKIFENLIRFLEHEYKRPVFAPLNEFQVNEKWSSLSYVQFSTDLQRSVHLNRKMRALNLCYCSGTPPPSTWIRLWLLYRQS